MQRCVPTWRPAGEDSHRRRPTPAHGDRGLSSEGDLPLREAAQGQPPPAGETGSRGTKPLRAPGRVPWSLRSLATDGEERMKQLSWG